MAFGRVLALAVLLRGSALVLGDDECSADGECGSEESSLLALRGQENSETRRRLPPITCHNRNNAPFNCAGGDSCCGDACVAMGDVCCVNINGNTFPCGGQGGGCCGNACFGPGSKCCRSFFKPKNLWYPVSLQTQCRSGFSGFDPFAAIKDVKDDIKDLVQLQEESSLARGEQNSETRRRLPPITCHNRDGAPFNCAGGDSCCGDACVAMGDYCCVNMNGNTFPCGGQGGGCCGNACFGPGSKCCRSFFKPKNLWYPVSLQTQCRSGFSGFDPFEAFQDMGGSDLDAFNDILKQAGPDLDVFKDILKHA